MAGAGTTLTSVLADIPIAYHGWLAGILTSKLAGTLPILPSILPDVGAGVLTGTLIH